MEVTKAPDGKAYLHVWRTGTAYERQKGDLFRKDWTNIKFSVLPYPPDGNVHHRDIRRPLPLPDATFDAVYANHVVEHLAPGEAAGFVSEARRVLKPGGICRIVVPDLESACREYLKCLEDALSDRSEAALRRYRWAVFELIDQMVREEPGGLMMKAVRKGDFDTDYAKFRYGDVFEEFGSSPSTAQAAAKGPPAKRLMRRISSKSPKELGYAVLRKGMWHAHRGDPRRIGEANRWMWDRLSLDLLLNENGFQGFSVKSFAESDIANWSRYQFDKSNHGDYPFEPSVYVEARKAPA